MGDESLRETERMKKNIINIDCLMVINIYSN